MLRYFLNAHAVTGQTDRPEPNTNQPWVGGHGPVVIMSHTPAPPARMNQNHAAMVPRILTMQLLQRLYDGFNARDIENVLAFLHEDVTWANGMEGGYVHGRDGVRSYWTRQWAMIDPRVEPVGFSTSPDGAIVVQVHQTVRDLQGNVLHDKMVGHIFRLENELVKRFDIQ